MQTLADLAKTIRSKNAGVDRITFDVIFAERGDYELVCRSGAISRSITSGSPGDADIFGSQQYGPLLGVEVPEG